MKHLLASLAPYNKALVPLLVGGVLTLLAQLDITGDMTVKDALGVLFTSALVWLVPNLKKGK